MKPFVICTTDGFIVDIYGFYEATKNDAAILTEIIEKEQLMDLLASGNLPYILFKLNQN